MSFRTAISTTAGADQVLAVYNHRLAQADFVMLAASGTPSAWPAPQLLSRSPPRASRAGSWPKLPALKRATLHVGSKHAEILSKQAEIVLKRAENTRKTVDWLVTFASISPSQRPCAYAG